MSYTLDFTNDALDDIEYLKKTGDKAILKKLAILLEELAEHPTTGTGQPEEMKHNFSGCWSRRINSKHRIIYRIVETKVSVVVLYAKGHYFDK